MKDPSAVLQVYQKAVNQIEDYLEYRYREHDKEDIRTRVMQYIDQIMFDIIALTKDK